MFRICPTPLRISLLLLLTVCTLGRIHAAIPLSERNALIAFYQATGGDEWFKNSGWLGLPGTEGTWFGITIKNDHVVKIQLLGNNLTGGIPDKIQNLPFLEVLDFDRDDWSRFNFPTFNYLENIPPSIGKLIRLRILNLDNNLISSLPGEIGDLESLEELYLGGNRLTSVPSELGSLTNLWHLDLWGNEIVNLPLEFGDLDNLEYLDLTGNPMPVLPLAITDLAALLELRILNTGLKNVPVEIGNLKELRNLSAFRNEITSLPDTIGQLTNLEFLDLEENQLSYLPPGIGGLTNLRVFWVHKNQLAKLPTEIGDLTALERLWIGSNQLTGLPPQIGNLSNLQILSAHSNQILNIPPQLGKLKKLKELYLNRNQINGQIPGELGGCRSLEELDLSQNQITGSIPNELKNLETLDIIDLEDNLISGTFPSFLCDIPTLRIIRLSNNRLSGHLPSSIRKLSGRLAHLKIAGNQFNGPLPLEVRVLSGFDHDSFGFNALEMPDPAVAQFVENQSQNWKNPQPSQTLPPKRLRIQTASAGTVSLEWEPIYFTGPPGGYEIFCGETSGGQFEKCGTILDKSTTTFQVTGLDSERYYYFQVRSFTAPHEFNQNRVTSEFSTQVSMKPESQAQYLFPLLKSDSTTYTGLAISNTVNQAAKIEFSALRPDGTVSDSYPGSGVLSLKPGYQFARLASEIFGSVEDSALNGWVELSADHSSLTGLFQIGDKANLDGGLASPRTMSKFFFTRVNESERSAGKKAKIYIVLANPNRESVTLRLRLYRNQPLAIETNQTLPPRGAFFATLQEIFGDFEPADGFIESFVVDGSGVTGFQLIDYGNKESVVILPARDDTSGQMGYSAQIASGNGWFTSLHLANVGFTDRQIILEVISDDGSPVGAPKEISLLARRSFESEIREILEIQKEFLIGSLKVTADGNHVIGDVLFGEDSKLRYAAGIPLQRTGFENAWCSHVDSSENFYTGLALYNPAPGTASVQIEVISKQGIKVGEAMLELKSGQRISRLISELIPSIADQMGGSIRIFSNRPIIGQQFFGNRSETYLSSVPPVEF